MAVVENTENSIYIFSEEFGVQVVILVENPSPELLEDLNKAVEAVCKKHQKLKTDE